MSRHQNGLEVVCCNKSACIYLLIKLLNNIQRNHNLIMQKTHEKQRCICQQCQNSFAHCLEKCFLWIMSNRHIYYAHWDMMLTLIATTQLTWFIVPESLLKIIHACQKYFWSKYFLEKALNFNFMSTVKSEKNSN